MPEANLTRAEARARKTRVDVAGYDLAVTLKKGATDYEAEVTARFTSRSGKGPLFLDAVAHEFLSLALDGEPLDPGAWDGTRIHLPEDRLAPGEHVFTARYRGALERRGLGFHRFVDPVDGGEYVYTNLEPYEAHRVFPCFDQPDLKATYRLTVTAPAAWKVISNVREDAIEVAGDTATHRFPETARFSTYLFNLTAGPYVEWEDPGARIPSRLFARPTIAEHVDHAGFFATTRAGFDFYEEWFETPYAFCKYDQVLAPEFMTGAMENVGAVLWNDTRYVPRHAPSQEERLERDMVLLHEMAHMWFGNLVTMRWWDGLWLNESFATYISFVALAACTEFTEEAWVYFDAKLRGWALWQDHLSTTHPIQLDVPETKGAFANFDGITYGKGCCALRQLAFTLGDEAFRKGVAAYFKKYAWSNTSNLDFLHALGEAAGREVDSWASLWLDHSGVNEVRVSRVEEGVLRLTQTPGNGDGVRRPHRFRLALFHDAPGGGFGHASVEVSLADEGQDVLLPELPGPLRFADANYRGHGYFDLVLDEESVAALEADLGAVKPAAVRSALFDTLKQMQTRARLASPRLAHTAVAMLATETYPPILESLAATLPAVFAAHMTPEARAEDAGRVFARARTRLEESPPETPGLAAWYSLLLGAAFTAEDFAYLGDLLDGAVAFPGLPLESVRRWQAVGRLVEYDAPGAGERLGAERDRDPSDLGRRHATRLAAARPDEAAKAAAWAGFLAGDAASLELEKAAYTGFHSPAQARLLAPYADRYLAALPEIDAARGALRAISFAKLLFPKYCGDAAFGEAAEALATGDQLSPPVTRALREGLDDWRRLRAIRAAG